MKVHEVNKKVIANLVILLYFGIFFKPLTGNIHDAVLVIVIFFSFLLYFSSLKNLRKLDVYFYVLIFSTIPASILNYKINTDYLQFIMVVLMYLNVGKFSYVVGVYHTDKSVLKFILSIIFVVALVYSFTMEVSPEERSVNPNVIGMLITITFLFLMCVEVNFKLLALLWVLSAFITWYLVARASFLTILLIPMFSLLFDFMVKLKNSKKVIFHYLYAGLAASCIFLIANIEKYLDREIVLLLQSGREDLWFICLEKINESLIFGHGFGVVSSILNYQANSAHNIFLHIALQGGLLTLLALLMLLMNASLVYLKDRNFKKPFIGLWCLLTLSMFEVFIFQNNVALGLLFWILISYSYGSGKRSQST